MSTTIIILVLSILFLSTLVRSTFGFGDALVAMPLLVFVVELDLARAVVALVSITVAVVVLLRDWKQVRGNGIWHLVLGALIGIPIGVYGVNLLDERWVKLMLGLLIVAYSWYCLLRPKLPEFKSAVLGWIFGLAAGVLGGAYNTAGPPMVIYGQGRQWTAQDFRATLQGAFLPISLAIVFWHAQADLVTRDALICFAASMPGVFVAIVMGRWLNLRLQGERFATYVHGLLIVIGASLLFLSISELV